MRPFTTGTLVTLMAPREDEVFTARCDLEILHVSVPARHYRETAQLPRRVTCAVITS